MTSGAQASILLVDDDVSLLDELSKDLRGAGYAIDTATNGEQALEVLQRQMPDLLILDISFGNRPDEHQKIDGLNVLQELRKRSSVPVLMLSGISVNMVKIHALTAGADDYLTKPYDKGELLARVAAILRRTRPTGADAAPLRYGTLQIDPDSRQVWREDELLELTALEFDLLLTLARKPGKVMSRQQLVEEAWSYTFLGDPRVVDVHIMNLRRKVEDEPARPKRIVTVRGRGYRFDTEP